MNELIVVIVVFLFALGLCIGSFLNVVVLRAISGESIVFPSSKCPKCQTPLKWYDNIPLISYLILRGKCRSCKEHISLQYPIVELSTGIMFLLSALWCISTVKNVDSVSTLWLITKIIVLWVVISSAIVMIVSDFKEKCIFTVHSFVFIASSLVFAFIKNGFHFVFPHHDLINALIGLVVGVIIMEAIVGIFYLILKKRIFGEGDTYIVAGMGALLGWKYLLLALFISVIIQALCFIPSFINRLLKEKSYKVIWSLAALILVSIALKIYTVFFNVYYDIVIVISLLVAALGVYTCLQILKSIKTKQDTDLTYLPFGPALLITTFFILFFGTPIVRFLKLLV